MILGKPSDPAEAALMLRQLRGHAHQVYTALALIRSQDGSCLTDVCATDVPMRDYSDEEIEAYVASGDPLDKAGAYAIQHPGFKPVAWLEGCFANVMGLPLCHLARNLSQVGISVPGNLPQACQSLLEYSCPVYERILLRLL
jgi:MAF protein